MRRWLSVALRASLLVGLAVVIGGCGASGGGVGAACTADRDCGKNLGCVGEPFPGGYCTRDCSGGPCDEGQVCAAVAGQSLCLRGCAQRSDCREGQQCFGGACTANCVSDADCGKSFHCDAGQCTPYDGTAVGAPCANDVECASRVCLFGKCAQSCGKDSACATDQTCALNPVGDGNLLAPTTRIAPACTARRGTSAGGAKCGSDADCDRGTCQLGVCVELCETTPDCHESGFTCAKMFALVDNQSLPGFSACLPGKGLLEWDTDSLMLPLPSTAQSFSIYTYLPTFNFANNVGVLKLDDPKGVPLYRPPHTTAEFFALTVRYSPSTSVSTMLVPNQPKIQLIPGGYPFDVDESVLAPLSTRIYIKLADAPIASGTVVLNFYLTDLSGSCHPITVGNAATELASVVAGMKALYAKANITISAVNYRSALSAHNVVRDQLVEGQPPLPDLDETLQVATANQPGPVGLDVVIVRSITDANMQPSGVLGIAGGIPSSPVLGTPHSGAIVSISNLCQNIFDKVAAHEVGHTLGLFHNVESTGDTDPLTDTRTSDQNNLMYWLENAGTIITAQQGQVMRNNSKVQP